MTHAELEVLSEPTQLGPIRAFVRAFCHEVSGRALDEESVDELELAANEAASNIIRHAHRDRAGERLKIEADGYPNHVAVRFWYGGDSFDPSRVRPPAFDGSREGGFGVYFIAQCVDEIRYSQDSEGTNCIALIKNRSRLDHGSDD
jgi:serine/threonine-protein kinase RsbW